MPESFLYSIQAAMCPATADGYFGKLQITQINLLVCDECHRAVKKDPYNCIMQEFYHDRATEVGVITTCSQVID